MKKEDAIGVIVWLIIYQTIILIVCSILGVLKSLTIVKLIFVLIFFCGCIASNIDKEV